MGFDPSLKHPMCLATLKRCDTMKLSVDDYIYIYIYILVLVGDCCYIIKWRGIRKYSISLKYLPISSSIGRIWHKVNLLYMWSTAGLNKEFYIQTGCGTKCSLPYDRQVRLFGLVICFRVYQHLMDYLILKLDSVENICFQYSIVIIFSS